MGGFDGMISLLLLVLGDGGRGLMGVQFVVLGPIVFFSGPRTGSTVPKGEKPRTPGLRFLRTRLFWMFQIGNVIEGLGYFVPQLYMPCESLLSPFLLRACLH